VRIRAAVCGLIARGSRCKSPTLSAAISARRRPTCKIAQAGDDVLGRCSEPCASATSKGEPRVSVAAGRRRIIGGRRCSVSRMHFRQSPPYGRVEAVGPRRVSALFLLCSQISSLGILGELLDGRDPGGGRGAARSEHGLDRSFLRILYDQQRRPKRPSSILLTLLVSNCVG